jgi:hypothetical protein
MKVLATIFATLAVLFLAGCSSGTTEQAGHSSVFEGTTTSATLDAPASLVDPASQIEDYGEITSECIDTTQSAIETVVDVVYNGDFSLDSDIARMNQALESIYKAADTVEALTPPEGFEAAHLKLLEAFGHFTEGCNLFKGGFNSGDTDMMMQSDDEWALGRQMVDEAARLVGESF